MSILAAAVQQAQGSNTITGLVIIAALAVMLFGMIAGKVPVILWLFLLVAGILYAMSTNQYPF
jgi:hypothetical protein